MDASKAPWTDEQVEALNLYQKSALFHPFTCGNDSRHQDLVATNNGWICQDCDYTQDWAHPFMMDTDVLTIVNRHAKKGRK